MLYIPAMQTPLFPLLLLAAAASLPSLSASPLITSGDKIAFLGDSITQYGASNPAGYVQLIITGLAANDIAIESIPAGISGNTSDDMLARVELDVLVKKPTFMTLSCGVNDVWKGPQGVPLDRYEKNITAIVAKAQEAGIKPIILTATMISEKPEELTNQQLAPYNAFLVTLAKKKNLPLADLNAQMQEAVALAAKKNAPRWNKDYYLTSDSVHMGPQGDQMMAEGVLRALGLTDTQIARARARWLEIPNAVHLDLKRNISLKDYNALAERAAREKLSFVEFLDREFQKMLDALPAK